MADRLPLYFILITVVLDAMGIGLIMPVMPDLIREVQAVDLSNAAIWGGILAAVYALAVGFIHTGKPPSFVYDIADILKFDTVVPIAFRIAAKNPQQPDREVRIACRDQFRKDKVLKRLIPLIEEVLSAGEI